MPSYLEKVITETYALDEIATAYERVEQGKSVSAQSSPSSAISLLCNQCVRLLNVPMFDEGTNARCWSAGK
jgi:hypothetical protein